MTVVYILFFYRLSGVSRSGLATRNSFACKQGCEEATTGAPDRSARIYTYTPKLIQYITFIPHDPTLSCRGRPSLVGFDDDGPPIAHVFSAPRRVAFISKEHAYPTYYYRSSAEHMGSATVPCA